MGKLRHQIMLLIALFIPFFMQACLATNNEGDNHIFLLKEKMRTLLEDKSIPFDSVSVFLEREVMPLVKEGNSEAAKILLPYLDPENDVVFASRVHNIAFSSLGEESYVETALWLYSINKAAGGVWALKCLKEGHDHPRLYSILAHTFAGKAIGDEEMDIKAIRIDAENGNLDSMIELALLHSKNNDYDGAKMILNQVLEQSHCPEGYDIILDDCVYYTAPMELSACQLAHHTNIYTAYSDGAEPYFIKQKHWAPEGEPMTKVRAMTMLGYTYLLTGDVENGSAILDKAVVWDWNLAMKFHNDFINSLPEVAIQLLKTAAAKGSKQCAGQLALIYSNGRYVNKNPALSLKYARQALDPEDTSGGSEFVMANALLANGRKKEADQWMKKSANKGCKEAIYVIERITPY